MMHLLVANFELADPSLIRTQLNAAQQERFATIHHQARAMQYFWSRVLYNGLIKRLTGLNVTWDLPKDKIHPPIAHGQHNIFTSLSHTSNWICLGYDMDYPLGVDIESIRQRDWQSLSQIAFDETTQKHIASSQDPLLTFYSYWGIYECRIKLGPHAFRDFDATIKLLKNKEQRLVVSALGNPNVPKQLTVLTETLLENW